MSNLKTLNSVVRTGIAVTILGAVGYGGYFGYTNYVQPGIEAKTAKADLEKLQGEFADQKQAYASLQVNYNEQGVALTESKKVNDKLTTSLKLLKVDRRMANLKVMEKGKDEDGKPYLLVRFAEIDPSGNIVGVERDFTLQGDRIFVDCWVVTFEDKYIESADDLRAASLCVFKSIFGNVDGPEGAFSLDQSNTNRPPGIYNDQAANPFEQKIWDDFWGVSNDPEKQRELGIRASYGDAPNIVAEEGKTYKVMVRASGGVSLKPIDTPEDE